MESLPPYFNSNIFNTSAFYNEKNYLTKEEADKLYLSINTSGNFEALQVAVKGIAEANKCLILDSSLNISGINDLSSSYLQTKNTSNVLITNSSNGAIYGLHLHSVLASSNGIYSGSSIAFNNSSSDNVPLSAIWLDKIGSGIGNLAIGIRNGSTCDEVARFSSTGLNVNSLSINNTAITATATEINYLDITTLGTFQTSKVMTLNASGIGLMPLGSATTNNLRFYGNTANKQIMFITRASDDGGLIIGSKAQTTQTNSPFLSIYQNYDVSGVVGTANPAYIEMARFNTKLVGFTDNYQVSITNGYIRPLSEMPWITSGWGYCTELSTSMIALNLCCNKATGAPTGIASSNNLLLTDTGKVLINTTTPVSSYQLVVNGTSGNNGAYISGNATVLNLDNTTGTTSDRISMTFSHNTTWEWSLGGSAHGTVPNGLYWYNGTYRMVLSSSGYLGLGGITSPVCQLDVGGVTTVTTTTNIAINTYYITVTSGAVTNMGGGPVTVNICARFRNNIWVQDKIVATSDRRLKTDINNLDFELEHFKKLRPVSYRMKNEDKIKLGVIAQEVNLICGEAISYMPNENMKIEEENDIEGYQMGVDYTALNMMNIVAIKKLINKVEEQEIKLQEQKNIIDNILFRLSKLENE